MSPEQIEGERGRCADRHLRVRRGAVRDGHRPQGVHGQEPGEPARRDHERRAAAGQPGAGHDAARARSIWSAACLAKDPDARFQTAHDVWLQLRWIAEGGSAVGVPAPVVSRRRSRERLAWAAAAVLGVIAVAASAVAVVHLRERPAPADRCSSPSPPTRIPPFVSPADFAVSPGRPADRVRGARRRRSGAADAVAALAGLGDRQTVARDRSGRPAVLVALMGALSDSSQRQASRKSTYPGGQPVTLLCRRRSCWRCNLESR